MLSNKTSIDNTETNVVVSSDGAVASLSGCIDIDSSPAVRDRLLAFLNAPHPYAVTIDLSSVTHMDSSGVATLIEALKVARVHGTEMGLRGLNSRLLRLFEITGILPLFSQGSSRAQLGFEAIR